MPDSPNIIEYPSAVNPGEIQIRRDGPNLVIIIPPPALWRSLLVVSVRGVGHCLFLVALILFIVAVLNTNSPASSVDISIAWLGIPIGMLWTVFRFTLTASAGTQPTTLVASAKQLEMIRPRPYFAQSRTWPAAELADISVREGRILAVLAPHVIFQVILTGDRVENFEIAWNGVGALVSIEDNLRDVLGLPHSNPQPTDPST